MRRVVVLALALAAIIGATLANPTPASASQCNVVPAMNLYTLPNGESGCGKIVISHINGDPGHFWLSWYVQDVTDWGSDADLTVLGFYWNNGNQSGGFLGSDQNSADYIVQSGYQYRTVPIGVDLMRITGSLTIHGTTVTRYLPVQHEWI